MEESHHIPFKPVPHDHLELTEIEIAETPKKKRDVKKESKKEIKPRGWTDHQYAMFFQALKEYGQNFTKISEAIGANRVTVSQFYRKFFEKHQLPLKIINQPKWHDAEQDKLIEGLQTYGNNLEKLDKLIKTRKKRSI